MFIPRSVKRKRDPATSTGPAILAKKPCLPVESKNDDNDEQDDNVKMFSSQQRLVVPDQDEPECVVCGKYGEYINDDTDHDICSLECKRIDNGFHQRSVQVMETVAPLTRAHLQYSLAEHAHAKLTCYQEPASLASQSPEQIQAIIDAHHLTVVGKHVPRPILSFDQLRSTLGPELYANTTATFGSMATGLQRFAIPVGLMGHSTRIVAPADTVRKGAYLIPLLAHCQSLSVSHHHKRRAGPYVLVLAPRIETCRQIETLTKRLAEGMRNTRTALLVGGDPISQHVYRLRKGAQILIGTPGRVMELMKSSPHWIRPWRLHMVVLDGADTLLHQGMRTQTLDILRHLSTNHSHQFFLASATPIHSSIPDQLVSTVDITVNDTTDDPPTKT